MTFKRYFIAELKRISHLFPEIFGLSVLFFAVTLLAGKLLIANSDYETGKTKFQLGAVTEGDSTFIDMGIYLFESFDDSKYYVELIRYEDFDEAADDLKAGKIRALAVIPEEFVDAIDNLSNDAVITYYTVSGERGITGVYMEEITKIVSNYIEYSEAGIFELFDYCDENGISRPMAYEASDRLFMSYIGTLLNRGDLVEVETLGIGNGLSTYGYYFTGLSLFFVCVLSFAGISFFIGKNRSLERMAYAQGISPAGLVFADFVAYYLCCVVCVVIFLIPVFFVIKKGLIEIVEFFGYGIGDCLTYLCSISVAMLLIVVFQLLIFEVLEGTINKIIFSFVIVLGSAYTSGLLYPKTFFPISIQKVGEVLPTGVANSYVSGAFTQGIFTPYFLIVLLYSLVLFLIMCLVRRIKIVK